MRGETCCKHGQGKTPLGYRLWPRCVGGARAVACPEWQPKWRQGSARTGDTGWQQRPLSRCGFGAMSCTPGYSRQVAGLVVPVGELPELAQSAPPAR